MKISILGTGALGIAIAKVLENKDNEISMWTKFEEEKNLLNKNRGNDNFLPGIKLDKSIIITDNLEQAVAYSSIILIALPFIAIKDLIKDLKKVIKSNQIICTLTKGIDDFSFETTTQIIRDELPDNTICALSGPSFAIEIANNENIYLVLASKDIDKCSAVEEIFKKSNINIEKSSDEIGAQICGAIKNAIAIGSGILFGKKAAESTKAAYLARGIKDMTKVVESLGGKEGTVYSFAGIGDLILTCVSEKSRNFNFGKLIGEGMATKEAFEIFEGKTVEGIKTIEGIYKYAEKSNIDLDIIPKLYKIIYNSGKVDDIEKQ